MPKAVILVWDVTDPDFPGQTWETDDPYIIELLQSIFSEDDLEISQSQQQQEGMSLMQQPLVTRMEPA